MIKTSRRRALSGLILIMVLAAASFAAAEEAAPAQREKCPVCGMYVDMFADWNTRIDFADSTHATFDGTKCMFKYLLDLRKYYHRKEDIRSISAKDYVSREPFDARRGFYVIWSDIYGPMGHEPIAFAAECEAVNFLKEHKGKKVIRFGQVTRALIRSLDNP